MHLIRESNLGFVTKVSQFFLQIRAFACVTLSDVVVEIGTDRELSAAALDSASKGLDALVEAQMLPQMRRLSI